MKGNPYLGSPMQAFDVRSYTLNDGTGNGVRAIDVWNGADLCFTILPDRCMDLYSLRYRGKNIPTSEFPSGFPSNQTVCSTVWANGKCSAKASTLWAWSLPPAHSTDASRQLPTVLKKYLAPGSVYENSFTLSFCDL